MKSKQKWENYGDVTPQEGGRYLHKNEDDSYDVIEVKYLYDDDKFIIDRYMIDLDDIGGSWIEKESVLSFIGMTGKDFHPLFFMLGAVDYYGTENFGGQDNIFYTEEEMLSELEKLGCI